MKTKKLASALIFTTLLYGSIGTAYAATKVVSPKKPVAKTTNIGKGGVSVSAIVRGKKSVRVYFKNLNKAKSVSYMLSYKSKQGPQGALGTIATKGKYSLTRDLLFGTCSNKVCRYDTGIKDCVLEVTSKLKNGKTDFKRIKLRV